MNGTLTLTERVHRLEEIMGIAGIGGGEFSGCDQAVIGVAGEDTQRRYNERLSQRIDQEPPQQTALDEIIHRIHTATDRILRQACALEDIGSRILGSWPRRMRREKTVAKPAVQTARSTRRTLDQTHAALNGLDYACARLEAAALRLERI